jgi:predicted nucleic acid-binding protein
VKLATLYLDTSIIGGYFDDEWRDPTHALWRQMQQGRFRFLTSDLAAQEIESAPENVRDLFDATFSAETLLELTAEMEELATAYVRQGVVSPNYADDARHVAICTVARVDYLVSWNFQHLVNVQREAGFNAVNLLQGYPSIRIVSPLELIHGSED